MKIIHNHIIDFYFIKFPIIFPLLYFLSLNLFPQFDNLIILLTLIFLAEPHFGATWPFLLHSINTRKLLKDKFYYIYIPLIIIFFSIISFFLFKNLLYLIFYLANFYHVTRQSSGISKLFINNKSSSLVNFQTYAIYSFGILFMLVGIIRFQLVNLFELNLIYLNLFVIILIFLTLTLYFFKFRSLDNISLLITGILIFYPICFVDAPIHAIIMGVTMHYSQYIFLTYKINNKRNLITKEKPKFNFLFVIFLYGLIMGLFGMTTTISNYNIHYLILIPLTGQLLHFYYDSLLWKFSDAHNREVTLKFI